MSKTDDASTKLKAGTEQFTEPFFDTILFLHPPSNFETRLTTTQCTHGRAQLMVAQFTGYFAQLWKLRELRINNSNSYLA